MKHMIYTEACAAAVERIAKGQALLTAGGDVANTMTIGWGSIGYCWNKPVMTVYVRPQRHTHDMIREKGAFTVSISLTDDLNQECLFAGRTSGREIDKFTGHGLTAIPAQEVEVPIVKECQLHFECVLCEETVMRGDTMTEEIKLRQYPGEDYHTIYMGEIVACYRTDID